MKADLLEAEFASRGVPDSGGPLLLRATEALAFVSRASDEGVPVLGVDGFTARGTEALPGDIADYSDDVAQGHGCWQAADLFIRERSRRDLLFEVTLGDDPVEVV
jgi:hypothetical protein